MRGRRFNEWDRATQHASGQCFQATIESCIPRHGIAERWGVFPFPDGKTVIGSDINEGLYLVRLDLP